MKLFELFATLGLDTSRFEAGVAEASRSADGLIDGLERLGQEAGRAGQGMQAGIAAALPGIRAQAAGIRAALAGAFDLSGVSVRWPSLGGFAGPGGGAGVDGSHAVGLPYVPFDGYVARLHEGERVLTRLENQQFSRGETGGAVDASAISQAVAVAVREAMQNVGVYMDGVSVGHMVAETVSSDISGTARTGRYQ